MNDVLCSVTGEPLWEGDDLTEEGHTVYSEGDCWALAWHLAAITGGRLCVLVDGDGPDNWIHVVVETGHGIVIDHSGVDTVERMTERWSAGLLPVPDYAHVDFDAYVRYLDAGWVFPSRNAEARTVAVNLAVRSCIKVLVGA